MAAETGTTLVTAPAPSTARTTRICSVAYATDEIASEERTASAVVLLRRSCSILSVASGRPTSSRLRRTAVPGRVFTQLLEAGYTSPERAVTLKATVQGVK